jgi:hypothetical protein
MPELSRFFNIIIRMYFGDDEKHHKPHIHAVYAEHEASIGLDGELLDGSIPIKQLKLVEAWLILHEDELYKAWNMSVRHETPNKVAPLK